MAAVGLVVEGIYDEAALIELVRKCHRSEVDVICRPCGSASQLIKKFPGFFGELSAREGRRAGR